MTLVLATASKPSSNSPAMRYPSNNFEENLLEAELQAEICQRFVRLSCEKMLASRNSRGGARLHKNLLILHLLRKARHDTKMLPYECSSLLKRHPQSSLAEVSHRVIKTGNQVEQDQNSQNSVAESDSSTSTTTHQQPSQQSDDLNDSTTTLIIFDTNDESDDQQEDIAECMLHHQPHVSRPLYHDGYHRDQEDSNVDLNVELEYKSDQEDENLADDHYSTSPMKDVNFKIDGKIFAQSSVDYSVECEQEEEQEDIIDVVGDTPVTVVKQPPKPLSPIGSHLLKSSGLRSYSSSCTLQDIGSSEMKKEDKSKSSTKTSSKFSTSSFSSFFSFSSSSSTTAINYQYEMGKEEPVEYKVQDRHENHEDYGLIDFSSRPNYHHSHHHSSTFSRQHNNTQHHTTTSCADSTPNYNSYKNDEEEFQKQQRRHFGGRLYERCNFSRMQPEQQSISKSHSSHKARESIHRNSSSSSPLLLPFKEFNSLASGQITRLTNSKMSWQKEVEEDAIEEGTDAAELDCPPLPLRPSSDWLHPINNRQLLPNIQSIMATPLSPPMTKQMKNFERTENELPCSIPNKHNSVGISFSVNNASETSSTAEVEVEAEEEDDYLPMLEQESTSPPKMFYCSPPTSPTPDSDGKSAHLLVYNYFTDDEEEDFQAPIIAYEEEEGFFEEEEEENRSHIRKRKTTGNGAGNLAVLEKRPCCEDGEVECSDGDSGVDVNGIMEGCQSGTNEMTKKRLGNAAKPDAESDQTVPVAAVMLNTPLMFL